MLEYLLEVDVANTDFKVRTDIVVNNNIFATNSVAGQIAINTSPQNVILTIAANDAIQIPSGNTGQRPALSNNIIRFNTDIQQVEFGLNGTWGNYNYPLNCGRLYLGGWQTTPNTTVNTSIGFFPYNGNYTRVNGTVYQIPTTGVIANVANCSLNGTGGTVLANNTVYYAYVAANTSGNLVMDFSTTGHSTSTQANNIGTEIKTGDNTRTLVGMIYTTSNTTVGPFVQWSTTNSSFHVLNWFNRRQISNRAANSGVVSTGSTWIIVNTVKVLLWGDELGTLVNHMGWTIPNDSGASAFLSISIGAGVNNPNWSCQESATGTGSCIWAAFWCQNISDYLLAEGLNTINGTYWNNVTTLNFDVELTTLSSG